MAAPDPEFPAKAAREESPSQQQPLAARQGTGRATRFSRLILVLVVLGTLAIIGTGLVRPATPGPSSSIQSTSARNGPIVGTEVGNAAPNFTLPTPSGQQVSLSDYRGRPVLLNFWYATCPGCLAEMPGLERFYAEQRAAGKDFVILGVNVFDDTTTVRTFARQRGLTYPLLLDPRQLVDNLYNLNATPTSYFIDRRGIIRVHIAGPLDENALRDNSALID